MTMTKILSLSALLIALGNFTQTSFAASASYAEEELRVPRHAVPGAFHEPEPEPEPQPQEEPNHNPAMGMPFEELPEDVIRDPLRQEAALPNPFLLMQWAFNNPMAPGFPFMEWDEEEAEDEQHAVPGAFHEPELEPQPQEEPNHNPAVGMPFEEFPEDVIRDRLRQAIPNVFFLIEEPLAAPPLPVARAARPPVAPRPAAPVVRRGTEEPALAASLLQIRAAVQGHSSDEESEDDWDTE